MVIKSVLESAFIDRETFTLAWVGDMLNNIEESHDTWNVLFLKFVFN